MELSWMEKERSPWEWNMSLLSRKVGAGGDGPRFPCERASGAFPRAAATERLAAWQGPGSKPFPLLSTGGAYSSPHKVLFWGLAGMVGGKEKN